MNIFASDLDQTLIFSNKALEIQGGTFPMEELELIENLEGHPCAYISRKSIRLLKTIMETALLIPATTRTLAQYSRIMLAQKGIVPAYAITSNGGNVLIQGEVDLPWQKQIMKKLKKNCPPLSHIQKKLNILHDKTPFITFMREADEFFIYCVIEKSNLPEESLIGLTEEFASMQIRVSFQGRKLYVIPEFVDKAIALEYILNRIDRHEKVLAAGDSLLDLGMLLFSDMGFIPAAGELARRILSGQTFPSHIQMAQHASFMGAEEILTAVSRFIFKG